LPFSLGVNQSFQLHIPTPSSGLTEQTSKAQPSPAATSDFLHLLETGS
jgi:hypothetical protein